MNTMLRGKHLITFNSWTMQEIETLLDVSFDLKRQYALGTTPELLRQMTLFMVFFEQSTRTRNSLEAAMTQLGGHAHDLTPDKMQITHGESPKDTAKVLSRMGEAISIRNCFYGIGNRYISDISQHADIPIISMQDDIYHPLQAIADIMTLQGLCHDPCQTPFGTPIADPALPPLRNRRGRGPPGGIPTTE